MIRFVEISTMKSFFLNYKNQLLLLLVAIIWLLVVGFIFQIEEQTFLFGDSKSYYIAAIELYTTLNLGDHRPLIISTINGFPLVFGFSNASIFVWSWIINLICWLATILLIFSISKRFVKPIIAFYTALFYIFCLGNLFIVFHLLSETIFTFCLVFAFYLIKKQIDTSKIKYLIFAISILTLAVMIKPLSLLLVLVMLLSFYKRWIDIVKSNYSILFYLSCCLLFFQMYTMKKEFGNFTVSYIDSHTYYNYLGTRADCIKNNTEFIQGKNERYVYFAALSHADQKRVAATDFKKQLTSNPVNLIKAYCINLFINSTKGSAAVFGCENKKNSSYFNFFYVLFKAVSKVQNCALTFIGLLLSLLTLLQWKRNEMFFKLAAIVIFFIIFISGISSDQGDRFHIVLYPLILLLLCNYYPKRFSL